MYVVELGIGFVIREWINVGGYEILFLVKVLDK